MSSEQIKKMKEAHRVLLEFPFTVKELNRGYADRFLRIDLDKNEIKILPVTQQMKDLRTGGKGFDLWLLFQEVNKDTKWDSPNNPICFSPGPLAGTTSFPGSGKTLVTSVSPITQSIMDCNVGGFFGPYFKFAGFDALVIVGKAKEETIIFIDVVNEKITIETAPLEKIDSHVVAEELTEMYADNEIDKRNISVVSSGSAAIHSRMGILNFSLWDWRRNVARVKQAGRGGIGTVFRDKNLKALVVKNRFITPAWRISESKAAKEITPGEFPRQCGEELAKIDAIIEKWGSNPECVFDIMCDIQDQFQYISKTAIERIQDKTTVPKSYLYHMVTFFDEFSLEKKSPAGQAGQTMEKMEIHPAKDAIVFRHSTPVDPGKIDDTMYAAFKEVVDKHTGDPDRVVEEIKLSGLRGRGGAGFATALKWQAAITSAKEKNEPIYLIGNAARMQLEKAIIEQDPHALIEGMLIGAFAVEAKEGFIYIDKHHEKTIEILEKAIETARKAGYLGTNIKGTGLDFDITVRRSPGDFLSGESSAVIHGMSGQAWEAQPKYVHNTEAGFRGKPTILDNIETWVNIPVIIDKGAKWFSGAQTKVFTLSGVVSKPGFVEAALGTPLKDVIESAGGIAPGKTLKAIQIGGPSGGIVPADQLDMALDFDTLQENGAMIGSGKIVLLGEESCIVDFARQKLSYLAQESCGRCTPCREGLYAMVQALDRICEGKSRDGELEFLEETAVMLKDMSLCQLGGTAPNPVLSTLKYFKEEYKNHLTGDTKCCGKTGTAKEVK